MAKQPTAIAAPQVNSSSCDRTRASSLPNRSVLLAAVIVGAAAAWSYWPNLVEMVRVWMSNADYSHGFLVIPLVIAFLYMRRDKLVASNPTPSMAGLSLVAGALVARYFADKFYLYELATYTLVLYVAGACWMLGGWQFFLRTLPCVAFLIFAMKLPSRLELAVQVPLRQASTVASCWLLQFFGVPAFAEANKITLGENVLQVANACAGLRMSLGVLAMAYAFILLAPRPIWQKAILAVLAMPIAVAANTLRIVATAFLFQFFGGEVARKFLHDLSGILTIPAAALLYFAAIWITDRVTTQVPVHRSSAAAGVA